MLEPWIIEQIRRREEEERRRNEQPRLEIPIRDERYKRDRPEDEEDDENKDRDGGNRGVVIIEI
ncbi:MAG TPA: hypothetical protein VKQ32_06860 [Polyangia bacterium]|nr:hypothetical protein [Polyangia bacterium]